MPRAFGYFRADSATAHRYVASQYNAGAGAPVRRDIGVQPVALSTARVRCETILNPSPCPLPLWGRGERRSFSQSCLADPRQAARSPGAAWSGSSGPPLRRRIDRSGSPQRGAELGWVDGLVRRREMNLTPKGPTMRPVMVSPSTVVSIWYSPRGSLSVSVSPATLPPMGPL